MTTTTLSSRGRFKNLLLGMLRKNLPATLYLTAIYFFFFPLQMILSTTELSKRLAEGGPQVAGFTNSLQTVGVYTTVSMIAVVFLLIVSVVVLGVTQSSYLHSKRAVDLYHSLPVTRTELMTANMITAFLTVMVPYLLNYIVNFGALLWRVSLLPNLTEPVRWGAILLELPGLCVAVFATLAVIFLVSTQVGSIFENFIFACELLVSPLIIFGINEILCEGFLVGYASRINFQYLLGSSPVSYMVNYYVENWGSDDTQSVFLLNMLVWLAVGAAVYWAALTLYRRRKSELAECPGARGVFGNLLTILAVYIGGIGVGAILFSAAGGSSEAAFLACMVIGAALVFFLVEAILCRGFSGIRRTLPLGGFCCLFVLAATFAVTSGGLGYETRVPAANTIREVNLNYRGWHDYITELDASTKWSYPEPDNGGAPKYTYSQLNAVTLKTPEAVELVRQIHLSMLTDGRERRVLYSGGLDMFSYQLNHGRLLRRYTGFGDATRALLAQLCELPEFQEQTNPLLRLASETVEEITLHDNLGFQTGRLGISRDMGTLLEALRQDALANGTRDYSAAAPVLAYLYFDTGGEDADHRDLGKNLVTNFSAPVFASYTNTISVLKALGLDSCLTPADSGKVTEIGVNRYSNYRSSDAMVSGVGSFMVGKREQDYMLTDLSDLSTVLENAIRFDNTSRGYNYDRAYFTLFSNDEQGITVALSGDKLPAKVNEMFPELAERYERRRQKDSSTPMAETNVVG